MYAPGPGVCTERGDEMPFATNGGLHIHYEVEGNGAPLVLYHGLDHV